MFPRPVTMVVAAFESWVASCNSEPVKTSAGSNSAIVAMIVNVRARPFRGRCGRVERAPEPPGFVILMKYASLEDLRPWWKGPPVAVMAQASFVSQPPGFFIDGAAESLETEVTLRRALRGPCGRQRRVRAKCALSRCALATSNNTANEAKWGICTVSVPGG